MDCEYFTNPYNFVPLEGKCVRSGISLGKEECLTGYFTCTIKLLTPLFIPNTSCSQALCNSEEREKDLSGYEFFSYEDLSGEPERDAQGYTKPPKVPVICGSEIRGAVRSVYEAAFGGCMSTAFVNNALGRRHPRKSCTEKETHTKTLETILEANGGFQPCHRREELCPACRLFGMVSKKEGGKDAVGSRVRFTDATLKNPKDTDDLSKCYMKPLVLPESGEPHPDTVEFYTLSPYADPGKEGWRTEGYWTYDYKCIKVDHKVIRKKLPDHLPMVRGRKFYWHNNNWKKYMNNKELDHVMQQRIRPVKESDPVTGERQFCFRVYFDRINQQELEYLRWSLDFSDSECAHKLGRGKPFGFGSIRIHIDDLKKQKINLETGELELVSTDYKDLGAKIDESGEAIKSLKLMANWKNRPLDVGYPVLKKDKKGESFRWFVKNRKKVDSTGIQPEFSKILPKAVEELGEKRNQKRRLDKGK